MPRQDIIINHPKTEQNSRNATESLVGKNRADVVWAEVQANRVKLAWKEGSNCDPYAEGYAACERGLGRGDNPFSVGSTVYHLWDKGFVARSNQ